MLRLGGVGRIGFYILIGKQGFPLPPPPGEGFSERNQDLRETKSLKGKGKM